MTNGSDLGPKTLFRTNPRTWKWLKSNAPSAKMTKRVYLGLKTLICTILCTFLKIAKKWCAKCKNRKTFWCRAENAVLNKPVHFGGNRWKVVRSLQKWHKRADIGLKSLFCTNSCTLLKIAKKWCAQCENDTTCCSGAENWLFSAKCRSLYKTAFSARDQQVLSFSHWVHQFLTVFSKLHEFVQNSVSSPRSSRFVIFALTLRKNPNIQEYSCIHYVFFTPTNSRVSRTCTSEYPLFRVVLGFS